MLFVIAIEASRKFPAIFTALRKQAKGIREWQCPFATARAQDAILITCDAHFAGLPGVMLIEKITG